jgi:hypothetical protein
MIEMTFSSSKSHFGVSAYSGVDNKKAQNCIAVALAVHANPNLNCGVPMPTPTGMVIALNTHYVGMTWGDFVSGLNVMCLDIILQTLLSKFGSWLGGLAGRMSTSFAPVTFATNQAAKTWLASVGRGATSAMARALRAQQVAKLAAWNAGMGKILERLGAKTSTPVGEAVIGFIMGSPTGADAGTFGAPTPYGAASGAVDEYLNGPTPENLEPTAPPPISPPPPPERLPPPPPPPEMGDFPTPSADDGIPV